MLTLVLWMITFPHYFTYIIITLCRHIMSQVRCAELIGQNIIVVEEVHSWSEPKYRQQKKVSQKVQDANIKRFTQNRPGCLFF